MVNLVPVIAPVMNSCNNCQHTDIPNWLIVTIIIFLCLLVIGVSMWFMSSLYRGLPLCGWSVKE